MCQKCADAVREIFPEVPSGKMHGFLLDTTCFPFGSAEMVRKNLEHNRSEMQTGDWNECYEIAERELDEEVERLRAAGQWP